MKYGFFMTVKKLAPGTSLTKKPQMTIKTNMEGAWSMSS